MNFRDRLGKSVVIIIVIGTTIIPIALMIMIFLDWDTFDKSISFIGQSLLPLWGTWVGLILAFYFGKSNFESASRTFQSVIDKLSPEEKIASINVSEVMIPFVKMSMLSYEKDMQKTIIEVFSMQKFDKDYSYFPVVNNLTTLKYIINRKEFTRYVTEKVVNNYPNEQIKSITLDTFIKDAKGSKTDARLDDVVFISKNASLLDAKRLIERNRECYIITITQSGDPQEPIIGFISNNIILNHLIK